MGLTAYSGTLTFVSGSTAFQPSGATTSTGGLSGHGLVAASATQSGGAGFGQAVMSPPTGYSSATVLMDDTFSGTNLNTNNWITELAAAGSIWNSNFWPAGYTSPTITTGTETTQVTCEVFGPTQVTVNNGLTLTAITPIPTPPENYNEFPSYITWYSGCINSMGKVQLPATGWYVQIRAKRPDITYGAWPATWFMPDTSSSTSVEFDGDDGGVNATGSTCNYYVDSDYWSPGGQVVSTYNCGVDLSASFNTYGFEYLPPGNAYGGGAGFEGSFKSWINGYNYFNCQGSAHTLPSPGTYCLLMTLQIATAYDAGWHNYPDGVHNGPFTWEIAEVQFYKAPGT